MKEQYLGLVDILKLVFCIGITLVHCCNYGAWQSGYGWYILSFCVSTGVAYFFVASGYFLGKKLQENADRIWSIIKNYCIRLLWSLLFWDVINVIVEIINAMRNGISLSSKAKEIIMELLFHPGGAMWYIQALIVGVLMWGWFINHNRINLGMIVGVILYVTGSLANSSYYMVEGTSLEGVVNRYLSIFDTPRNGVFAGFMLAGLGIYIAYKKIEVNDDNRGKYIALLLVSFVILTGEIIVCNKLGSADNHSMFYSILVFVPVLFLLAASVKTGPGKIYTVARKLSAGIYYSHVPMIVVAMAGYRIISMEVSYGLLLWITDVAMCIILCFAAMKVDKKYINKVIF